MPLKIFPLKSRQLGKKFNLLETIEKVILKNIKKICENDILIISSKVVALSQGRMVELKNIVLSKRAKRLSKSRYSSGKEDPRIVELVFQEADKIFPGGPMILTLKENILIPQAGIDLSNAPKGFAILWPEKPWETARMLWRQLREKNHLKKIGIVICDSHCQPLRWGTTGIALAWAGFEGIEDIRGEKDICGKPLKVTRKAVADNLASAGLLLMGEAAEKIPFVIIRNAPVKFTKRLPRKNEIFVKPKDCVFAGMYNEKLLKTTETPMCSRHQ